MLSSSDSNGDKLKKFELIKERIKLLDKSGVIYTLVNFGIYAIYFLRALLVPKILDSYSYGVFSVFNLFLKFSTIFDLGSISYLQKEVAVNLHTKNEYDQKLERQVIFLNVSLVLISTFFFLLFNQDLAGKISYIDYLFWISIAVCSQLFVITTGILRSLEKFKILSKVLLANAILSLTIVAFFFLDVANIYLIYSVYLLGVFLPILVFITRFKFGSIFPLRFLAHSWPIFLYNILFYFYTNVDKFTIKDSFSFLQFSTYSLYSTITTSVFMAVSLLWSMFYSRIFSKKSDIAEKLDTMNALLILVCVCALKVLFPVFHTLFPNYVENAQFYEVSLLYGALVFFLPNTLIKYLNIKRMLFFVCCVLFTHLCFVFLSSRIDKTLELLPLISWLSYFFIEMIGVKNHNKLYLFVRIIFSLLVVLVCLL